MTPEHLEHLRCPLEGGPLVDVAGQVRCGAGHHFDLARQGYLNLTGGGRRANTEDTAAMVSAREVVFEAGHLRPLSDRLAAAVAEVVPPSPHPDGAGALVDLGAGTGHHLARALDAAPGRVGLALDLSVHAARRAARRHPRMAAVVCDLWQPLPVRTATAAVVLSVFAPRSGTELARILRPEGYGIVVTPTERHLHELIDPLGLLTVDADKAERLAEAFAPTMVLVDRDAHEHVLTLDRAAVRALVEMGPSAHHLDEHVLTARLEALPDPVEVTVSVTLGRYRRR